METTLITRNGRKLVVPTFTTWNDALAFVTNQKRAVGQGFYTCTLLESTQPRPQDARTLIRGKLNTGKLRPNFVMRFVVIDSLEQRKARFPIADVIQLVYPQPTAEQVVNGEFEVPVGDEQEPPHVCDDDCRSYGCKFRNEQDAQEAS